MDRTFTVEATPVKGGEGGRFTGKSPSQAAKKAGRALLKLGTKRQIKFTLREMTQGSDKKEFKYTATKVKLDTPKVIERGNVKITIQYEYLVKSC
jgi:hypothetical protein